VLEAMCSKLPVVAANAGGIPEMIEDGVSGYLIDTDAQAIERIGELLHSQQKREAIGERARAEASGRSWREATLQLLEHYDNAIEQQALRAAAEPDPSRGGLRASTGRAVRRATLLAARKLLP